MYPRAVLGAHGAIVQNLRNSIKCSQFHLKGSLRALVVMPKADHGGQHEEEQHQEGKQGPWSKPPMHTAAGCGGAAFLAFNLFGLFKEKDEEKLEDKLIMTIKRSILCIQREQYDQAEQMLHLALRMAQDIQSRDGITYVYDVMANLAMERGQYTKAEKLFKDVMQRLFANGVEEDNPKILHISAKIAKMAELQGELEKARIGFLWTIKKLENILNKNKEDEDVKELYGLINYWFGQLEMKCGEFVQAKKFFLEAYNFLNQIHGKDIEEAVDVLNDLSVACASLEQFDEAKAHLQKGLAIVKNLGNSAQEAVLQANLGMIHLREGFKAKARELCSLAFRLAKKCGDAPGLEQSKYCLDEIEKTPDQATGNT